MFSQKVQKTKIILKMDKKKNIAVDIILPVYNAYEEFRTCIYSIKKWTDLKKHRIIIINDCSTDKRVVPFMEQLKRDGFIVIHNTKNQGFSANVNTGMAQSLYRDVILLNSDTIVTKNWVEKLSDCAYSSPWTATVTPLSNHATLCSVPYFGQDNKLPEKYTVDTYADLIQKISLKKYPVIPVANGFCMYIKRTVIHLIGGFDEETFARGYGEENDFCYRASKLGYRHVMCDDTFIFHKGTASFMSEEKRKYIAEHEKILNERFPRLTRTVRMYCRLNPAEDILCNIRMRTRLENMIQRKSILYLLQTDFRKNTNKELCKDSLYSEHIKKHLRQQNAVILAAKNEDCLQIVLYADEKKLFFKFLIREESRDQELCSLKTAQVYGKILDAFQVSAVYMNNAENFSMELYDEADKRRIHVFTKLSYDAAEGRTHMGNGCRYKEVKNDWLLKGYLSAYKNISCKLQIKQKCWSIMCKILAYSRDKNT